MDDPIKLIEDHQKRVAVMNGDGLVELSPDGNSLDFLQACYRNSSLPISTRMRAALGAIPFELPRLAVTAVLNNQDDFATRLDRCIARAKEMRMLPGPVVEHSPSELRPTNGFKRRF